MSETKTMSGAATSRTDRVRANTGSRWPWRWMLLAIVAVSSTATIAAMRRTSTTFDEIVMIAAGARGWETGRFELSPEHPPFTQYLYGLPVYLSGPRYPAVDDAQVGHMGYRYRFAQEFFWQSGNDPERLAFLGRMMAALCALLLVVTAYAFVRRNVDEPAAVVAAALVAFLPDVLAHGGVSYNDVPLALAYMASLWAIDAAVRRPVPWRGALAGSLAALALGVKFSAVALGPAAVLLLATEGVLRRRDRAWRAAMAATLAIAGIVAYLTLVMIYRGDFALEEMRYGLSFMLGHVSGNVPGYLLGEKSIGGWWYFFPVAFLFKTPVALHILLLLSLAGYLGGGRPRLAELLGSPLRAPLAGAAVFLASLLNAKLVIGFRYALPLLPLLCILVAVGVVRLWRSRGGRVRWAIAGLLAWFAASSLSYYPFYLSYTSEYVATRDRGHEVLLDSSLDWGQGLLELRDYLREEGISRVYLSYFGSALPAGYGIDYVALPSFFPLPADTAPGAGDEPTHAVVSATNLHGVYLTADPFAQLRQVEPVRVIAHTLFVYRVHE